MGQETRKRVLEVRCPVTVPTAPDETISLTFEKVPGGRGGYNRWTINGKSWPDTNPLFRVREGGRYRLLLNNNSGDTHPVHMHRHTFEVTKVRDTAMSGLMKDTISLPRYSTGDQYAGGRSGRDLLPLPSSGSHGRRLCRSHHLRMRLAATVLHGPSPTGSARSTRFARYSFFSSSTRISPRTL